MGGWGDKGKERCGGAVGERQGDEEIETRRHGEKKTGKMKINA
jgi:hypothetical protein